MLTSILAILGPLAALMLILVARRAAAGFAVGGAVVGVAGALAVLADVTGGRRASLAFGGLPGAPLRLDHEPLTALVSATVATVAALVVVYAVGYMHAERDQVRFYAELCFFVAAMQALVLAGDWLLFLACWELIGLASYLLIGFWFERPGVPSAATRAFLTTRGADIGLYIAVFALISRAGTSDMATSISASQGEIVVGLLLLLAAMGKSAQVPFQGWLQDAMLGPTPVSALLHSATLVAAGAILLVRAAALFPPVMMMAMAAVGGLTILLTGLVALAQQDLKRSLAASTSSQLGFMLLAVGAGSPVAALVHLVAHAAMKAGLFLGAGIFQHATSSTAFEALSGAGRAYPRTFGLFALAGLALAGVPPLAGFWSKEAISAAAADSPIAALLVPSVLVGSILTGAYVGRILRLTWQGSVPARPLPGVSWMMLGLAGLALVAAAFGLLLEPIVRVLGVPLPENQALRPLGPIAAVAGLAAGWTGLAERLVGPVRPYAASGFRIVGGWSTLVVRPAMAVAQALSRADRVLERSVAGSGSAGLALALASRRFDESDLDDAISAFARAVQQLSASARRLQSGFVWRELALAVGGAGAILVGLLLLS